MRRLGYVPALDGLRAIAIAGVVGTHYWGIPMAGGLGVDLFFVLSGFLITTLLLEEHAATSRIHLLAFYGRRARRLFPALAVLLAVYLVVTEGRGARTVELAGLYAGNLVRGYSTNDPLVGSPLGHLWSLATEEQFYLLWPCLLILLLRLRRAVPVLAALLVAVVAWRAFLVHTGAPVHRIQYAPDARADGLLAGCVLACLRAKFRLRVPEPLAVAGLAVLGLAMIAGPVLPGYQDVTRTMVGLAGCVLVAAAVTETPLAQALSARPLVWLGKISYSLYLWHFPILAATGGRPLIALPASLAAAWLSYRFIETRFRRRRVSSEKPSTAGEIVLQEA